MFGKEMFYINIDDFTVELIRDICSFRPQAIMGGEIRSYQKEVVPRFIAHLKEVLPGKYEEFIKAYPEFDKEIDHVGRKALLKTINPSYVHYKSRNYPNLNSDWYWDGEQLKYVSGYVSSFSVAKNYDIGEISLVPTDKTVVKIEDNKQVNSDTVFLD